MLPLISSAEPGELFLIKLFLFFCFTVTFSSVLSILDLTIDESAPSKLIFANFNPSGVSK